MEGKPEVPNYDPPDYFTAMGGAEAPSPAPVPEMGNTPIVLAEEVGPLRRSEGVRRLTNRIDFLQSELADCRVELDKCLSRSGPKPGPEPEPEPEPEPRKHKVKFTKGWVIFENSNAWLGDPGKYGHEQKDMRGTDIERRRFCIEHDIYGFVSSTGPGFLSGYAWCRDQAKNPDDLINHIETDKRANYAKSSVHISPGASISLIVKKIKKGYKVVFEDKSDENKIKNISGYKKKSKKTKPKKKPKPK